MAIEKKLICFARLAEFERQLAAGNILGKSIVFIQDAKKIWNWGTYYDCNGGSSVYAWEWDGSEGGSFSQEEFDKMKSADIVVVKSSDQMYVADCSYAENSIQLLIHTGTTQMLASQIFTISPEGWQLTETQVYSIPTKVSELDNDSKFVEEENLATINGQSLTEGGDIEIGTDNVYITDFTVNDLLTLAAEEGVIHASIDMLFDALSAHKVILVPYDANEGFQGYAVANGYMEDLLYLTVALTDGWIDLELNHDLNEIRSDMVTLLNWYDKQDKLVSGTNIKTINGESILGEGDLIVEGGAKVYTWTMPTDDNGDIINQGNITQEEFDAIVNADILMVDGIVAIKLGHAADGVMSIAVSIAGYGVVALYNIIIEEQSLAYQILPQETIIPTKTSELENDSNFLDKDTADGSYVAVTNFEGLDAVASIQAFEDGSLVYALPTSATGDEDDVIVTRNTLKTINNQSLFGRGNIEISGGNGGSSAYSEVNHGTADTTFTLTPNTFHVWDEVTSLTLDFGSETSGVANEFLFQFTSGSTATSLTLPDDIRWANDSAPTIEANMICQVSILKGLASVLVFSNEAQLIDNHATIGTGGVIDFAYPVASDLTISFYGRTTGTPTNMSATISSGEQSVSTGAATILYINSITPESDNIYNYTYDKS